MIFNTPQNNIAIALFLTTFLTACGGGSDSDSSMSTPNTNDTTTDSTANSGNNSSNTTIDEPNDQPSNNDITQNNTHTTVGGNDAKAALIANNEFSIARTSCGLGGLAPDTSLDSIAIKHANYIKYVFANSSPTSFNAHYENKIADIANVTSNSNPFFSGLSFTDRLTAANYGDLKHSAVENIGQSTYYSSAGNLVSSDTAASSMAKSLLAAPYHLRSLMRPSSSLTGTGVVTYQPYNKDVVNNRGYVLVNHAAATQASKDKAVEGVFTYPCQSVTGTMTALYNETPDPVKHTGRNLRLDPIGQPVYISMPSAKTIVVSNVRFYDVERNVDVPVELLDHRQDPYVNTINALPANEAFILPITDSLKSCEITSKKDKNCGLYGNSEYRVSFDLLVDNKTVESKSFTFTTGAVNY